MSFASRTTATSAAGCGASPATRRSKPTGPAAEPLTIETPTGRVTGRAASFYVGCHADDLLVAKDGAAPERHVVPVDFKNLPEPSRLLINAWAEEKTRGRIKDLVPQDADGLAAVEKQLTTATLQAWLGKVEARIMDVAMPKFRIESACSTKEPLEALGMRQAFDVGRANFDGICPRPASSEPLFISFVIHKAFVEVTEKGTEAAATAVGKPTLSIHQPFTPAIRADRPFLFAIRDVKTGTILFLGRMTDPTGTAVPAAK